MTTNTTPSGADALLQLIESYVEKRHTHGAPQYNVVTARARDAVLAALSAAHDAPAVPDTRGMFNAGWCAAARFCDREDAVYDGLVGPGGCPAFEAAYRAALSAAQDAARGVQWVDLTDDDRERAFKSMPDMLDGFLKKWGWLHFAKAIEAICREKNDNRAAQKGASNG